MTIPLPETAPRKMSAARAILIEMRPRQWTKNLVILVPLLFSLNLGKLGEVFDAAVAFGLFCLISGAVYIANDLRDLHRDRLHDGRSRRPLAAGQLSPTTGTAAAVVLAVVGLAGAFLLQPWFGVIAVAYLLLQVGYTLGLKHEVVLDVLTIAAGFVLRVTAGAVVVDVVVSPWLLTCALFLALFLGLAKRRQELLATPEDLDHRPVLVKYTASFLDQAIGAITATTIAMYSIYTFQSQVGAERPYLMLTIPFVVYGMLRYLYLMHARHLGSSPEEVLLKDKPLIIDLALWTLVVIIVLYAT